MTARLRFGTALALSVVVVVVVAFAITIGFASTVSASEPAADSCPVPGVAAGTTSVVLGNEEQIVVPEGDPYGFLGSPGATVWTLVPAQADDASTWSPTQVDGPGDLYVYEVGTTGEILPVYGTADGWPKSAAIPTSGRPNASWTFTRPGVYTVQTSQPSAPEAGGTTTSVVTFLVGDCQEQPVEPTTPVDAGEIVPAEQAPVVDEPVPTPAPTSSPAAKPVAPQARQPAEELPPASTATVPPVAAPPSVSSKAAEPVSAPSCPPGTSANKAGAGEGAGSGAAAGGSTEDPASPGGGSDPTVPGVASEIVGEGHLDFGALVEGSRLRALLKDDRSQPPSWVEPSTRALAIGAKGMETVPDIAQYRFLGSPGSKIWIIPQTQVDGVPWLGWNTQHETVRAQVSGPVKFTLDEVSGPGRLAVYLNDSFGGVGAKKFGTVSGFPKSFNVAVNVHAHANWAFTRAGTYRVTMTQSATLKSGKVVAATGTLTFRVGSSSTSREAAPTNSGTQGAAAPSTETLPVVKACSLGSTGAPPIAVKVGLGLLLLLLGVLTVVLPGVSDRHALRRAS